MDGGWVGRFGWEQFFEVSVDCDAVFLKESGKFHGGWSGSDWAVGNRHDWLSGSGSKGSAASLPSAFLRRISTRPSASSSCFWHSRESCTPSSKSFMAS